MTFIIEVFVAMECYTTLLGGRGGYFLQHIMRPIWTYKLPVSLQARACKGGNKGSM